MDERSSPAPVSVIPVSNGSAPSESTSLSLLPPLNIASLLITRAELVEKLRLWVPAVIDVVPLEGGRRYELVLPPVSSPGGADE